MFRPMRRFQQMLRPEDCLTLLKEERCGVLSVLGEEGYPYGIPMNHWYDPESGKLYFHGARKGHKLDAIRACDKVSYCVYHHGLQQEGKAENARSVVVFGRMRTVKDPDTMLRICTNLCQAFGYDRAYLERELVYSFRNILCLELTPEHISGKLVMEA